MNPPTTTQAPAESQAQPRPPTDPATGPGARPRAGGSQSALVGISISDSPDLAALGFGEEHLKELMGSIARTVLRLPAGDSSLVYGGDLRPQGFTRFLFDIVSAERAQPTQERPEPPRRIYSYLAWPHYLALCKSDEAQMINACHFMRIAPADAGFDKVPEGQSVAKQQDPPAVLVASRCLTVMRERSTRGGHPDFDSQPAPPLKARIMLGGKSQGYSSFMPGLFEELLLTRETGADGSPPLPVYVLGTFGGAAGQLARALLDPNEAEALTLDYQLKQDRGLKGLLDLYAKHPELPQPEDRYAKLREVVKALGEAIRGNVVDAPGNGLTPAENRVLLRTRDEVEVRRLLQKGLMCVCAGPDGVDGP